MNDFRPLSRVCLGDQALCGNVLKSYGRKISRISIHWKLLRASSNIGKIGVSDDDGGDGGW